MEDSCDNTVGSMVTVAAGIVVLLIQVNQNISDIPGQQ